MALLILLIFNGFITYLVTQVVVAIAGIAVTLNEQILCGILSLIMVSGLAFLLDSPLGQWFLRILSGARKPIEREYLRLDTVIYQVQQAVRDHCGFNFIKLNLMITDDPLPNAFAIGKDTLVISRALYETALDSELAGVIAHEMGHLHNGDSNKLGIALGVSVISIAIAWVAGLAAQGLQVVSNIARGTQHDVGTFVAIVAIFFNIVAWFFLLFVQMGNWVLKLAMLFVGRQQEYRADQFAIKAGFGAGLLSFLEKVKDLEWGSGTGLLSKLQATHPPVMSRIGEAEKVVYNRTGETYAAN